MDENAKVWTWTHLVASLAGWDTSEKAWSSSVSFAFLIWFVSSLFLFFLVVVSHSGGKDVGDNGLGFVFADFEYFGILEILNHSLVSL